MPAFLYFVFESLLSQLLRRSEFSLLIVEVKPPLTALLVFHWLLYAYVYYCKTVYILTFWCSSERLFFCSPKHEVKA
jgi:hypothetical protein